MVVREEGTEGKKQRGRRGWAVLVVTALVLSAVTNVLVAWGTMAFRWHPANKPTLQELEQTTQDAKVVRDGLLVEYTQRLGGRIEHWAVTGLEVPGMIGKVTKISADRLVAKGGAHVDATIVPESDALAFRVAHGPLPDWLVIERLHERSVFGSRYVCGWPWLCLWAGFVGEITESADGQLGSEVLREWPGLSLSSWRVFPAIVRNSFLPTRVEWPGFCANVGAYALAWLSTLVGVGAARRMLRRLGGRCESCGYDLRGLGRAAERCPECGTARGSVNRSI